MQNISTSVALQIITWLSLITSFNQALQLYLGNHPLSHASRISGSRMLNHEPGINVNKSGDMLALKNDRAPKQSNHETTNDDQQVDEKRLFVIEFLRILHEQYMVKNRLAIINKKGDTPVSRQLMLNQLIQAISADGDVRRLTDWIQGSFNLASIGELTTQFVVSKLGSVNCAALLRPDGEELLLPRFLLFNEHYVDVPFELPLQMQENQCLKQAQFDPKRKTLVLIHGFLGGYTLVDGFTNIKNQLLDRNRQIRGSAMKAFSEVERSNGSYVLTENLDSMVRQQQYNVILIDWFLGANPVPRSRYIRAAVNAQVVGRLIARFLVNLVNRCQAQAIDIELLAHSLGCHVAGFTGKAMASSGHKLGKITHLDPVGLCFGRLFSEPKFRLNPSDAFLTQAVHVSLNIFDNPLDGTHINFLVNGGRDQPGCGAQSELRNSTSSSLSLLYDPEAKFRPCSHIRALSLFEDDHSSKPEQCQMVGYKCSSYDRFLAGKCGLCDASNSQCRLITMAPIRTEFKRLALNPVLSNGKYVSDDDDSHLDFIGDPSHGPSNGSMAWVIHDREINEQVAKTIARKLRMSATPKSYRRSGSGEVISQNWLAASGERFAQTLDKLRVNTVNTISSGWHSLRSGGELRLNTLLNPAALPALSSLSMPSISVDFKSLNATRFMQPDKDMADLTYEIPIGGQALPAGSRNGPLYFVGTSSVSTYCVNYYQFKLLIAESRIRKLSANSHQRNEPGDHSRAPRDTLQMTIKLSDTRGQFFKGFSISESISSLERLDTFNNQNSSSMSLPIPVGGPRLELTMLLNSTAPEPVRIGETVISFYSHAIVLADSVEINYMSNISPRVRAKYSSLLCPVAINDKYQLVRYIDCHKIEVKRFKRFAQVVLEANRTSLR